MSAATQWYRLAEEKTPTNGIICLYRDGSMFLWKCAPNVDPWPETGATHWTLMIPPENKEIEP